MSSELKFTKVQAGWYATEDGRYAVVSEGMNYVNADGRSDGADNDGWSASFDPNGQLRTDHNAGENLDWFDTKKEAIAFLVSR